MWGKPAESIMVSGKAKVLQSCLNYHGPARAGKTAELEYDGYENIYPASPTLKFIAGLLFVLSVMIAERDMRSIDVVSSLVPEVQ